MNRIISFVFVALLLGMLASSCLFVVDQRKFALLFALGEIKQVIDKPGLHFKLPPPFQNVVYYDKRIQTLDTPDADRFITSEKKNVLVDSFVKWKIIDPSQYFKSVSGTESLAQDRIMRNVRAALNEVISTREVSDVVAGQREDVMKRIAEKVNEDVKQIGVQVVDVRLKRVDFVPEISESVYRRMASERQQVANENRATGSADGEKIRAQADREREGILANAYRDAQNIKGQGDAEAAKIYAAAFGQNPEFYSFYRSLDAYRNSFRNKGDMLVVEPNSEFFRYLRNSGGNIAAPVAPAKAGK
jgi:modulator of FtsH protease HflC